MKIAGVYKVTNTITGDFYIGSSQNIKQRWATHKSPSKWKKQPNSKLYKAMAEFGLDNFKFEVLEETTDLREKEQYYIEQLRPVYNDRHAEGRDIERRKETTRRYSKEWHKIHRNEYLAKKKAYYSRLCFYENETLTLSALEHRFCQRGIPHARLEAKKYLL